MTTEIQFDQYRLSVDYTHSCLKGGIDKGISPSHYDSDWDYYGWEELDWNVVSGKILDEHDNLVDLSDEDVYSTTQLFEDYIDELVKKEIDCE